MGLNLYKINNWFKGIGERIVKCRWLNIGLFFILIFIAVLGMRKIKTDVSDDNWFLKNDPMLAKQDEFEEIFGNNDFAAVLIEADDIFTTENLSLIRELSKELEEKTPFYDDITSLTNFEFSLGTSDGIEIIDLIPDKIPSEKDGLEKIRELALSKKILVNKFISDDSKLTWIMLKLRTFPKDWEKDANYENFVLKLSQENPEFFKDIDLKKMMAPELLVGNIFNKIVNQEKYRTLKPRTTGIPIMDTERDAFFSNESPRLMMLALLITTIILIIALRSLRGVIFPLLSAAGAMMIVFGFQGFIGITFDPIMVPLPLFLGLAVSIGYSIHIFTFFKRKMRQNGDRKNAVIYAVQEAGWPILFTALTTIGALMSFLFIQVRILRWVGLTSAGLVFVTYFLVLTLLPSLLSFGKNKKLKKIKNPKNTFVEGLMLKLNNFVKYHQKGIIAGFIIISVLCIIGLSQVEVSFDIERTLGKKIPYVGRFIDIGKTKIGSIYSYNLMVEFPEYGDAKIPENLRKFEILENEIKSFPLTKKTSSILDIIKDLNQVLNRGEDKFYKIPSINDIAEYKNQDLSMEEKDDIEQMIIAQTMLLYENAGGSEAEKWIDYDDQRLNMMVELGKYSSIEIVRNFETIEAKAKELFPEARVIRAGSIAKYAVMQKIVAFGQIRSFVIALIIIAVLLMLVFGSVRAGLIGMIPNIAPALVVGGVMGFFKIPLDMITVTIMPMLLGLAVDDTIHFINHSQLEFSKTGNYDRSIRRTFFSIGTALFMTSVVLVLNFSAYLTSVSNIYIYLGILACSGISAALLADFFITPILLKWGKVFGAEREENIKIRKVS